MTGITKWLVEHTVEDSSNQKAPMPRSGSRTMVALVVGCCALMWNAPREKGKRTGKRTCNTGKRTCNTIAGQPYHRASEVDRDPPLETKRRRLQTQFKPVRAKPNALDARIQRAQTFGRGRWRDD